MMRIYQDRLRAHGVKQPDFDAANKLYESDPEVSEKAKAIERLIELPMGYLHKTYAPQ
jgi:hypothetical protein